MSVLTQLTAVVIPFSTYYEFLFDKYNIKITAVEIC
jgi:hypothetical protein